MIDWIRLEWLIDWIGFIEQRRSLNREKFKKRLDTHDELAGGLRVPGSWKAKLTDTSSWAEILEAGKTLTSGPGGQVLKMKDDIQQDHNFDV